MTKKLLLIIGIALITVFSAEATIYNVTSTADAGVGTLRQAMTDANTAAATGPHSITFTIAGPGPHIITLSGALPALTNIVGGITIDGFSEPDFTTNPVVFVDGPGYSEFRLSNCDNSVIQGIGFYDFGDQGVIYIMNGSDNVIVRGCWIGLNTTGTAVAGGGNSPGIHINASNNCIIGGNLTTNPTYKVVITNRQDGIRILAGALNNTIMGTYIGTNVAGTAMVGTISQYGVFIQDSRLNTFGGTATGERNIISNCNTGVRLEGITTRYNRFYNNYVGTDITGLLDFGSSTNGFRIVNANRNEIGGKVVGQGNVISGNNDTGIYFESDGDSNLVARNYIGLGANGTTVIVNGSANNHHGVLIQSNNCRFNRFFYNVIVTPARGSGIFSDGSGGDTIAYNYIGTNATGTTAIGVGSGTGQSGVYINGSAAAPYYIAYNLITKVTGNGIVIQGGNQNNHEIIGNYIGTDVTGYVNFGFGTDNQNAGIKIANPIACSGVKITNNLIVGSANYGIWVDQGTVSNMEFKGNIIGMNKDGLGTTFGNYTAGLYMQGGTYTTITIGGTNLADRNIVSMNGRGGTPFSCVQPYDGGGIVLRNVVGATIQGNYVGVDATGNVARGNGNSGIALNGGCNNILIGGTVAGARNVICDNGYNCTGSGDRRHGIQFIDNTSATSLLVHGNYIGIGEDGTTMMGNDGEGVGSWNSVNITIGGTTAAHRNVISGNSFGIHLQKSSGITAGNHIIQGNYIGTDASGSSPRPNATGIRIAYYSGNSIGGIAAGAGNVISGSTSHGVLLEDADNSTIQRNLIGVAVNGTSPMGNTGDGIQITNATTGVLIGGTAAGVANTIAFNANGVMIADANSQFNQIRRNSIYCNGTSRVNGINLNGGLGNDGVAISPLISTAPYISAPTPGINGTFTNQTPLNGTDVIEVFYDNGCGTCQGRTYLGDATSFNSPAGGDWSFSPLPAGSDCPSKGTAGCLVGITNITATRTESNGNTSEFMSCDPIPLPVELISFTARRYSSDDVILQWNTSSETNNAYFELVRSSDGKTFVPVSKIQGHGNSTSLNRYNYVDEDLTNGVYYYMLIQVDFDGKQTMSPIVTVYAGEGNTIEVIPTALFSGELIKVLNFTGTELLSVSLVNVNGKVLSENKSISSVESYITTVGVAPGLYLVKVNTNQEQIIKKVFVY